MKYILFESSAISAILSNNRLLTCEYAAGLHFIALIRSGEDIFEIAGIRIIPTKDGLLFVGREVSQKVIVIDLESCGVLSIEKDSDLMLVLQKMFRFAQKFWNSQPFNTSERFSGTKSIVFPFPYSKRSDFRLVIEREPTAERLRKRGLTSFLLAYKYSDESAPKYEEVPDIRNLRKAGEDYIDSQISIRNKFSESMVLIDKSTSTSSSPVACKATDAINQNEAFKYMTYEQLYDKLTIPQREIVEYSDLTSPIKIFGPAGTGKTLSMVARATKLLQQFERERKPYRVIFFTHSRSTQVSVECMFASIACGNWQNDTRDQTIRFATLQDYCAEQTNTNAAKILDKDALDAKQLQLLLVQDAFTSVFESVYSTFKVHLSKNLRDFFENENLSQIVWLLQYEFSIQVKGKSDGDIDEYMKLKPLAYGLPIYNEDDKRFVFRVFKEYQKSLETSSQYDTDDIALEAIGRFNGPFWRRERLVDGYDYIFVDEMHLFNENEQQIFHFLTKSTTQKSVPICFAIDYSQAIGDRGDTSTNFIEKSLAGVPSISRKYQTIFRSSQQIAEFCAAITASGALMFSSFINPYESAQSGFTEADEQKCKAPSLLMFENDNDMYSSLKGLIDLSCKELQSPANQIAVVYFSEEPLQQDSLEQYISRPVQVIQNCKSTIASKSDAIVYISVDNINGLEFDSVFLVGVDEGRLPQSSINDISKAFIRFSALNQLYLASSRAKYRVTILGTKDRGISSCLNYAIERKVLTLIE